MATRMRQLKIVKQKTVRDTISIEKYLQEIGRIKLLTPQEEVDLVRRIKVGDSEALGLLTKANLLFVVSVAKQYQGRGLSLPDLISEGNIGLIKAAQLFDETRGFKFISYAVWWIRQQILASLAEHVRIVRLPINKIGSINKINRAYAKLEQELERPPTTHELVEILDMTTENVKSCLDNIVRHTSLDTPTHEDSSKSLLDLIEDESLPSPIEALITESLRKEIEKSLRVLRGREVDVIRLYYGLNGNQSRTLEEIGQKFGISRERTRQIRDTAIRRIRRTSGGHLLRKYLND